MTSNRPELLSDDRRDGTDRATRVASGAPASGPLTGVVPVAEVAPSLVAVAPEPVVTALPGRRGDQHVADALERLREALLAAEGSLDRVASTMAAGATGARTGSTPARTRIPSP